MEEIQSAVHALSDIIKKAGGKDWPKVRAVLAVMPHNPTPDQLNKILQRIAKETPEEAFGYISDFQGLHASPQAPHSPAPVASTESTDSVMTDLGDEPLQTKSATGVMAAAPLDTPPQNEADPEPEVSRRESTATSALQSDAKESRKRKRGADAKIEGEREANQQRLEDGTVIPPLTGHKLHKWIGNYVRYHAISAGEEARLVALLG